MAGGHVFPKIRLDFSRPSGNAKILHLDTATEVTLYMDAKVTVS
jgi:hypothetical protein